MSLIHSHIAKQAEPAHEVNPEIPRVISSILERAMAKSPEDRYQTIQGIQRDFERCLEMLNTDSLTGLFPVGTSDQSAVLTIPEKLYGREKSVAGLLASFNRVQSGMPELNLIEGYSGMGKTSLVKALFKPITATKAYMISGKFDQLQHSKPYSAFVQAFTELAKQFLSGSNEQLERQRKMLVDVLGDEGQMLIDVLPEVELIIGEQPPLKAMSAAEQSARFNYLMVELVRAQCSVDQPLVLFIDDLQWADHASHEFLDLLLTANIPQYFLFIGAYRNDEIDENYGVTSLLRKLDDRDCVVNRHRLEPLNLVQIGELLCDTLNYKTTEVLELAREIQIRTQGNPFFVNEFINSLYDNEVLTYCNRRGRWLWSMNGVRQLGVTDNVADLVIVRMQRLPSDTVDILKCAACIGAEFDVETLSIIANRSLKEELRLLQPAITLRLVESKSESVKSLSLNLEEHDKSNILCFKFLHDRIRQAAYSLMDIPEKKRTHWAIGRALLSKGSSNDDRLFSIVGHLNVAAELITDRKEKIQLARLNCLAGQKAKLSAAFNSAYDYFSLGIDALGEVDWERENRLLGELFTAKAETAYLIGNHIVCEEYCRQVMNYGVVKVHKVASHEILADSLWARSQMQESVSECVKALELLGLKVPKKGSLISLFGSMVALKFELRGRSPEELMDLPIATDPNHIAMQRIIVRAAANAVAYDDKLYALLCFKLILSSLRIGYTEYTATAFSGYSILVYRMFNNIDLAYRFGKLSLVLSEKLCGKTMHARNESIFYGIVAHFNEPLNSTLAPLLNAYETARIGGDAEFSTLALGAYCWHVRTCEPKLDVAISKLQENSKAFDNLGRTQSRARYCDIEAQALKNVRGDLQNANPLQLTGQVTKERELFKLAESTGSSILLCHIHGYKSFLSLLFKNHRLGYEQSAFIHKHIGGARCQHNEILFKFWDTLNISGYYPNANNSQKASIRRQLKKNLTFFQLWDQCSGHSYKHYCHAVRAEWYRLQGNSHRANNAYNAAVMEAKRIGWIQDEAIITERFASYCFELGWTYQANLQMLQAYFCYQSWGAYTKMNALENEHPRFRLKRSLGINNLSQTSSHGQTGLQKDVFDLPTVIQSSQVLTSEVRLDRLIEKLLDILLTYAGADKVSLLLKEGDRIAVEAVRTVENDTVNWVRRDSRQYSGISDQVVSFVARSLDSVVIDNVDESDGFSDIVSGDSDALSVVCFPLLSQETLIGLAYLENRSTRYAFLPSHLNVLKVIGSQAAISIEKSKLYDVLAQSEEKFRGIIENADIGIFQATLHGQLLTVNQAMATILGYDDAKSLMREPVNIFEVLSFDPESYDQLLRDYRRSELLDDYEVQAIRGDKSTVSLSLSAKTLTDVGGGQVYIEGFVKDITERMITERLRQESEKAQAASKSKSDFLANMSHEIRTPLNGVIGVVDLLVETPLTEQQKQYARIIKSSGDTLLAIINDILDISLIETGKMEIGCVNFDLHELLKEVELLFRLNDKCESTIYFSMQFNANIPQFVSGDPLRIRQILTNLLSNAFKFTSDGFINLQVSRNDSDSPSITFEVVDSGIGLSEVDKRNLFQSYYQAETTANRQYGGTGLGLMICQNLVNMLEGDIGVLSEEGKGATFWFTIQLPEGHSGEVLQVSPVKAKSGSYFQNTTILVVEDDKVNQVVIEKMLNKLGVRVVLAENGEQAYDLFRAQQNQFDLVIMDCEMPVVDGYEASRRIRELETQTSRVRTPIVALTANVMKENYLMCVESGMDARLCKPLELKSLNQALIDNLSSR